MKILLLGELSGVHQELAPGLRALGHDVVVGHSSGVNISYLVSSDAEVTVELLSLSGRTVRRLPAGRAATQARATVHWDGRGENGQPLPAGLYRLNISARADDGTQARFSQPILMLQ